MKLNIEAIDLIGNSIDHNYSIELPPVCPVCVQGVYPQHLTSYYAKPRDSFLPVITSLFLCPVCENLFMGTYTVNHDYELNLRFVIPYPSKGKQFSEKVEALSPSFCKIYNESYRAEQQGLTEICGMGYRKALEFLVKDYAISSHPDDAEKIKTKFLGQCISDYIDSEKLKALAKASSWLGNDQTHYVRQNPEYDLKDMKSFISAAVAFIDMELEIASANALLNR